MHSQSDPWIVKDYNTLLSSIHVGCFTLRNRVIIRSMHTRLENEPGAIAKQVAFHAERARGEAALLVTGGFSPNAEGVFDLEGPCIYDAEEALCPLPICNAVHAEGSINGAQICHGAGPLATKGGNISRD